MASQDTTSARQTLPQPDDTDLQPAPDRQDLRISPEPRPAPPQPLRKIPRAPLVFSDWAAI